ncbi:MAG: hypothetical protein ACLP7P_19020 [Rhodomicrobium sp.]
MWIIIFIWIAASIVIGSLSSATIGFAIFFSPLVYMLTYIFSTDHRVSAIASLGLIGLAIGVFQEKQEKAKKNAAEERRSDRIKEEERRCKAARRAEVENAYDYLMNEADLESRDLCNDYKQYYSKNRLHGELECNFEEKIIAKAKPLIDAEELRRREQEAIARQLFEKEEQMFAAKYGAKEES